MLAIFRPMSTRKIIEIDNDECTGCGLCIPNCPEGALQVIDGKVRLVSDLFCDGLGACIGYCPESAIRVVEREAEPYDERRVMANIAKQGANTIRRTSSTCGSTARRSCSARRSAGWRTTACRCPGGFGKETTMNQRSRRTSGLPGRPGHGPETGG